MLLCHDRAALEMYELELGYMVVVHAQRDPGEYMHQLQSWARLPQGPLRRCRPLATYRFRVIFFRFRV